MINTLAWYLPRLLLDDLLVEMTTQAIVMKQMLSFQMVKNGIFRLFAGLVRLVRLLPSDKPTEQSSEM